MTPNQILFDRLAYMDRLKSAGIPDEHARAHAEAMDEALREAVATKVDLIHLESRLIIKLGAMLFGVLTILVGVHYFDRPPATPVAHDVTPQGAR